MADELTLTAAQRAVDNWIRTTGNGYFSELTNMAMLTEEVGEVARIVARRFGDQVAKHSDAVSDERLADELADVMWIVMALANQTGVDLTAALERNIAKKNARDAHRFTDKSKTTIS